MKLRKLCSENTPRTILWRAGLAALFGLIFSAFGARFTGPDHFVGFAFTAIGVPVPLAPLNLLTYWSAADTQCRLREVEQSPNPAPLSGLSIR